ncbi:carboxypeptidase regulatory-like domain-containing protein [Carboxylicivirga sp. N1Y90]|uniref:carboxypeptidase regulatory-like domain-containing protein n=1 Tax=Carboxylicivirga fragile TaxID=3417571 RepID=UPI003D34E19F|nr:TonB-dependent receptor [Marinilabiliaceae bacterium N1Y90]
MLAKISLLLGLLLITITGSAQEAVISGLIKDAESNQLIEGVSVSASDKTTTSNSDGYFSIELKGGETYEIAFSKEGFRSFTMMVSTDPDSQIEIGPIFLVNLSTGSQEVPTITITESGSDNSLESQTIHGLLSSSRDVFVSAAAYTFGPARFRIRGYESELQSVMINGFIMNEVESGRPYWSNWGGLNDVMRNTAITTDADPTGAMYEPIGGLTNVLTTASEYRPGTKLVYSNSNRSYQNRAMITHSTGLMDNNWAFTVSGSRRWSQEGYKEATFYDANSFFIAAEKVFNQKHRINFTGLTAMYSRGVGGGAMQEVYDLVDDNYYNPYWGYQNGEKRNARVRSGNKPLFTLQHTWTPTPSTKVRSTVGYWFGKGGYTSLNWNNAKDPRPDYYRYLPSYYTNAEDQERVAEMWRTDPSVRQIDWDGLYRANRNNGYFEVPNANGIEGNTYKGNRSFYIVEDRRNDISQFQFNTNFEHDFEESPWGLNGGLNVDLYTGDIFNVVDDLLGGDYWLDIDQFAERDFPNDIDIIQNDLNNPNRIVKEGDIYSHHYKSHVNTYNLWLMTNFEGDKYKVYFGGHYKYNEFWREGLMKKGLFPDDSYGNSEKQQFHTFGLRAGGEYRFSGRHIVKANASFGKQPPLFRNVYVSPRTRDHVIPNLKEETHISVDAGYFYSSPNLTMRASGYYTRLNDQAKNMNFYHEELRSFVNYSQSNIDKQYMGFEFGAEYKITTSLSANVVASVGDYTYQSNPNVIVTQDNNQELLETGTVYSQGFKISGTPQHAYSIGLKYNSQKYWWAGVTASYFDQMYMDFNPIPRASIEFWSLPEQLDAAYTIDAFAGKSWRLDDFYISLSANLSNVTNNQSFITGGYEQLRFSPERPELFQPKYYYYYGFNYFINLSVSF